MLSTLSPYLISASAAALLLRCHILFTKAVFVIVFMMVGDVCQMIEMECFKELNIFGPDGSPSPDLIEEEPSPPARHGFFDRIFKRRRVWMHLSNEAFCVPMVVLE